MPSAVKDIKSIYDFIHKQPVHSAEQLKDQFYISIEMLSRFPERGKVVRELKIPAIREIALHRFRIIYRLQAEEVQILTIYHSSRLLMNNPWSHMFK